ncbi:MAG: hypothetical protein QM784_05025 [Polyangiaceae bacterium]
MDYPVVVPLVGATAEAVGTALSRVEGRTNPPSASDADVNQDKS